MTAQFREILHYEGKTYHLATEPLKPLLEIIGDDLYKSSGGEKTSESDELMRSTACWRGYVGEWEIKNDKLYMIGIKGYPDVNKVFTMEHLFPGQEKVFARWFSGEIRIPHGKLLHYEHMGYMSIYEKELFLEFKDGVLFSKREVDNTKTFDPENPYRFGKIS